MSDRFATLYGLKTCGTCRKAIAALKAADYQVTFVDVRAEPPAKELLADWLEAFGDALINKKSTTWRSLDAEARAHLEIELLLAHPTLMKRPVILSGGTANLGWSAEVQAALL